MYKIGDIIGYNTMDGLFLCQVVDIYKTTSKDPNTVCLCIVKLYNDKLQKPFTNTVHSIFLPQQRYEILTKEEYFEMVQHDIDRLQSTLDEIKEKYDN